MDTKQYGNRAGWTLGSGEKNGWVDFDFKFCSTPYKSEKIVVKT